MPDYRRTCTPGGAIFLTLVTFNRRPMFAEADNVKRLRQAVNAVKVEVPLNLRGGVGGGSIDGVVGSAHPT